MALEIERKYLVADTAFLDGLTGVYFKQGYISAGEGTTVRVRIEGERAVITLKGMSKGVTRSEYEYEIPFADAEGMLEEFCLGPFIEKTRYTITWRGRAWEVDLFAGENKGLVVAEIELQSEEEVIEKPPWLGKEVSGDSRYYNGSLVNNPFGGWSER